MRHLSIADAPRGLIPEKWLLTGEGIVTSEKRLWHLAGVFEDEKARKTMDPETLVYQVRAFMPVPEGTPGGLFFGASTIQSGRVGDEYFMTRGHFHLESHSSEYYWCVSGEGILILMNRQRSTWAEKMSRGSVHYIDKDIAHRVANTGEEPLVFGACWPSDAGHDYKRIELEGFSARLKERNGIPLLIDS